MAGVRDRKGYWQVWWLVQVDGHSKREWRRLSKVDFTTKKKALREAQRLEIEGERAPDMDCSFAEYMVSYMRGAHVSESTKSRYDYTAQNFQEFLAREHPGVTLKDINEDVVNDYINERKVKHSPAGINCDLRFLRTFFVHAVRHRIIKESPMTHVKDMREERKILDLPTKEEIKKILQWFKKNEPVFYPWIYFEATRGWRRDELRHLRVNDLDLPGEKLYIRITKTKEQRREPLREEDCRVLNEHIIFLKNQGLYQPKGYLFPSRRGHLMGRNKALERLKRARADLGITKNITNHSFRHYVVTTLLNETANIEVVKAVTGHRDTRTILDHYAHTNKDMVNQALEITHIDTGLSVKEARRGRKG